MHTSDNSRAIYCTFTGLFFVFDPTLTTFRRSLTGRKEFLQPDMSGKVARRVVKNCFESHLNKSIDRQLIAGWGILIADFIESK